MLHYVLYLLIKEIFFKSVFENEKNSLINQENIYFLKK